VTRRSILEYARAVRPRYLRASKKMKTRILDEFTAATKMHRKAAIRLLNRQDRPRQTGKMEEEGTSTPIQP